MNSNFVGMIFAITGLAFAQGPRGPQPNSPPQTRYGLDMSKVQTIEGLVGAVNAGYGMQYPSIQINQPGHDQGRTRLVPAGAEFRSQGRRQSEGHRRPLAQGRRSVPERNHAGEYGFGRSRSATPTACRCGLSLSSKGCVKGPELAADVVA